ncbi:MAG: hypothetical protein P8163_22045, partial [Candidatus Thiodiazotropha sp.]
LTVFQLVAVNNYFSILIGLSCREIMGNALAYYESYNPPVSTATGSSFIYHKITNTLLPS